MLRLTVETFLPSDFLSCEIDRWEMKFSRPSAPRPLGADLTVAARSWSRVYDYDMQFLPRARWLAKWGARPQPPDKLKRDGIYKAETEEDLGDLFDRLESTLAFLTLKGLSEQEAETALNALLESGVPVALWARSDCSGIATGEEIMRELLCKADFEKVPGQVRDRRAAAQRGQKDALVARELVLLWDDPGRVPEDSPAYYAQGRKQ
jgi:hypothetical protein